MERPHWLKLTPHVLLGLVLATAVSGAMSYLVVVFPQGQTATLVQTIKDYQATPTADPQALATLEQGRLDTENAIRTAVMQSFGGIAFLIVLYFTYWYLSVRAQTLKTSVADLKVRQRSLLLAEERQAAERFSQAVERLGHCNMHVRLGGIDALERLANDSDQDYPQIMAVLAAFVRAESPYPPKKAAPLALTSTPIDFWQQHTERQPAIAVLEQFVLALPPLRTDLQAVMTVIGRRKHCFGDGEWETARLDLRQTDLRKLHATRANLTGVNLAEAHLEGAYLDRADLKGADLSLAHLEEASLSGASLQEASLFGTHLEGACLVEAHLERVENLEGICLYEAHLEEANLCGDDLSQVCSLVGGTNGAISRFSTHNPTVFRPGFDGVGAGFAYQFNQQFRFSLGYTVDDTQANVPDAGRGIFAGNNLAFAQLTFKPTRNFERRLATGANTSAPILGLI